MAHTMDGVKQMLVNAPIPVNFAGLKGNTMAMQRDGWQLNVECSISHQHFGYMVRLIGKHPQLNLYMYSGMATLDVATMARESMMNPALHVEFPIRICAENIHIQLPAYNQIQAMPVDFSRPSIESVNMQSFHLEDLCVFRPINEKAEIYLPEKEIIDIQGYLDAILDKQKDKQKELREKKRKQRRLKSAESEDLFSRKDKQKEEIKMQIVAI